MITALSVNVLKRRKGIKGFADSLKKDRVEVQIKKSRGVQLKQIVYNSYSGGVRLDKISNAVGMERTQLLCSKGLAFPVNSGFRRFSLDHSQ